MDNQGFSKEMDPRPSMSKENRDTIHVDIHQSPTPGNGASKPGITFAWENITIRAGSKGTKGSSSSKPAKTILDNVSGYVRPGELVAIMGASGAGKTTLLNALTFRNLKNLEVVSGSRLANGVPVTPNSLTSVSAYVQQDDLFLGTLTVREQLQFQATVRMDNHIPKEHRLKRVESVLQDLGLQKCSDTPIGIPGKLKGISGGEKKRLAFACEVLTNPSLFFCDEPTSGLDSYMARAVVEVLRSIAKSGKTIICTIHQPSSQVFELFDKVLLMAEGRVAFMGDLDKAKTFFANYGFPCPTNYNPADHYIHVLAVSPEEEKEDRQRLNAICNEFQSSKEGVHVSETIAYQKAHPTRQANGVGSSQVETGSRSPYKASWMVQFMALLWRSFVGNLRDPLLIKVRAVQTIFIAVMLGVLYLQQKYNQAGVMNINGALFLVITNSTFQYTFQVVNVFCMELPIFLREHFNGMYRTDPYFLAKQLAELPVFVVMPIIFISIYYWMIGLNPLFERFVICVVIVVLFTQVVTGYGYFISCISPSLEVALAIGPSFIVPILIFGGFFLNNASIPSWLSWVKYISWFQYGNELLNINQWDGVTIDCNAKACIFKTGDDVLDYYGFDKANYYFDFGMLIAMMIGFRVLGFLALLAKTYRKS